VVAWPAPSLRAQQTTAERTANRETSSYADVMAFVDSLSRRGAGLRVQGMGESPLGKPLPLVIAAHPMISSPGEAHRSGKPVVYIQANIHAGEVEGKEALQMLLRDLTLGELRPLLDSLVLIAVPIYNADGNDRFGPAEKNRPGQNGPAVVGLRSNGQYLDLNRDYVKLEAPETRASVAVIGEWDPDVFMDLHTTNGSYHGYALTYAPGLNPNRNAINDYARDTFLPLVRKRMRERHQQEVFAYGNFRSQDPDSLILGWETYDARPRFGTNWAGMRNRMSILAEAYSNADFGTRISAMYNFVREVLTAIAEDRLIIRAMELSADAHRPDSTAVRSVLAAPTVQPVIAEITHAADQGAGGFARRVRTGQLKIVRMPVYDRFTSARSEARPTAYLLPGELGDVVALLRRQGVQVNRLTRGWQGAVEAYAVDSVSVGALFEGHRATAVSGQWHDAGTVDIPAGTYVVKTDQALGTFAAYLLEPGSEDGVVTWNMLDRAVRPRTDAPIRRVRSAVNAPMVELP
jgi:hypothetical protein